VSNGDIIEVYSQYFNVGTTDQKDVVVKVTPPAGLILIGDVILVNPAAPQGVAVSGKSIIESGINMGNYGPASNLYVITTWKVGSRCYSKEGSVEGQIETDNGSKSARISLVFHDCR
jgi:hypothetical protein